MAGKSDKASGDVEDAEVVEAPTDEFDANKPSEENEGGTSGSVDEAESEDGNLFVDETDEAIKAGKNEISEEKADDDANAEAPQSSMIPDEVEIAETSAETDSDQVAEEEVEAEESHEDDEFQEEHQASFFRKLAVGASLIALGMVLSLWLGPKIAPGLPSGMGPVRDWLMPGQSAAQDEIALLRTELEQTVAALPKAPSDAEIGAIVTTLMSKANAESEAQIQTLEARVAELLDVGSRTDASGYESRIATLENRIGGLSAQLNSLSESLTVFESDGSVSDEALAQIAGFTSNVEAVRAEVSGLVARNAELTQKLDEVARSAERRVADAETEIASVQEQAETTQATAAVRASLAAIDAAFSAGSPFEAALTELETLAEIPDDLQIVAPDGVSTVTRLRNEFPDAAHNAIRTSVQADSEDSILGRMDAFLSSQVATRSLTPQEGTSADAILSRAEEGLRKGDLKTVAAELEGLSSEVQDALGPWLIDMTERAKAEIALEDLRQTLQATN